MGKSRASVLNMAVTLVWQLCTVVFGLVVPRYFLVGYGADIHGLTSTISNILSYVLLLNAGLLTASVQALYRPLSSKNQTEVNAVLNAVQKYYTKVGLAYLAATLLLSAVLPLFIAGGWTVSVLMLVMGMSNIFDSFLGARYRVLMQADQKYWLIGLLNILTLVVRGVLQLLLIRFHLPVAAVQLVPVGTTVAGCLALKALARRSYPRLDGTVPPDYRALNQRGAALVHQIAGVVVNNTDTILLSLFSGLASVSVYTVYQMVFTHLYSFVTSVFSTSTVAGFGHLLAGNAGREKVRRVYDLYEAAFYFVISCVLAACGVLIGPFIRLYTKGVQGAAYDDFGLVILFMTVAILNNARVPCGMMINAAGHYQKTQYRAVAEAVINLSVSLLLVGRLGIYGVLIGTVVSFLYRTTDIILYTNRHILGRSCWRSLRRVLWMVLTVGVVWKAAGGLLDRAVSGWAQWLGLGMVTFCGAAVFAAVLWLAAENRTCREAAALAIRRLKR